MVDVWLPIRMREWRHRSCRIFVLLLLLLGDLFSGAVLSLNLAYGWHSDAGVYAIMLSPTDVTSTLIFVVVLFLVAVLAIVSFITYLLMSALAAVRSRNRRLDELASTLTLSPSEPCSSTKQTRLYSCDAEKPIAAGGEEGDDGICSLLEAASAPPQKPESLLPASPHSPQLMQQQRARSPPSMRRRAAAAASGCRVANAFSACRWSAQSSSPRRASPHRRYTLCITTSRTRWQRRRATAT